MRTPEEQCRLECRLVSLATEDPEFLSYLAEEVGKNMIAELSAQGFLLLVKSAAAPSGSEFVPHPGAAAPLNGRQVSFH